MTTQLIQMINCGNWCCVDNKNKGKNLKKPRKKVLPIFNERNKNEQKIWERIF